MTITRIQRRKDSKFLVSLHFNHGTNLRKVMTADELANTQASIEADRQRDAAYRAQLANSNSALTS